MFKIGRTNKLLRLRARNRIGIEKCANLNHSTVPEYDNTKPINIDVTRYKKARSILLKYDSGFYDSATENGIVVYELAAATVLQIAELLRKQMSAKDESSLYGQRHNDAILGIVDNIRQSFGGIALYPTVVDQASQLVYSMIKSHPFLDGNKRIASATLIHFLESNNYCVDGSGRCKMSDMELANLIIGIAESSLDSRDAIIRSVQRSLKRCHLE